MKQNKNMRGILKKKTFKLYSLFHPSKNITKKTFNKRIQVVPLLYYY